MDGNDAIKPDPPVPPATNPPPTSGPHFQSLRHRNAANFLQHAIQTGKLGAGPAEREYNAWQTPLALLHSLPWLVLIVQFVWSGAITAAGYFLARDTTPQISVDTLSAAFWRSRLSLAPSVLSSIGWALFVLLGLFISEASHRYHDAQSAIHTVGAYLSFLLRTIRQCYPAGTWHPGDLDRIAAHIIAYPIALKMTLRADRSPEQLLSILHPDDVTDVISADVMHVHCLRVIRSYNSVTEDDAKDFDLCDASASPAGGAVRRTITKVIDDIDQKANIPVRISEFRPAVAYINHLRIFLYIWLLFLPLALLPFAGWFTTLWSILITYGVGMLFQISHDLNMPFGNDINDIKLNRLSARTSYDLLVKYAATPLDRNILIDADHETPAWLEDDKPLPPRKPAVAPDSMKAGLRRLRSRPMPLPVFLGLVTFLAWSVFIILMSWGFREDRTPRQRWWDFYIPLTATTTAYVSLGVFLLLGFWLSDAYSRYWRGLQKWQVGIMPKLEQLAFQVTMAPTRGFWHERDRERILSHIVALPYAAKAHLRGNRDLSGLEGVLAPKDLLALKQAHNMPGRVCDVLAAYFHHIDGTTLMKPIAVTWTFGAAGIMLIGSVTRVESDVVACDILRLFPISRAFTTHLQLFTVFWLAVLPLTLVEFHGFVSFLYLVPIGYSIIKLLSVGREMADPFGGDVDDIPLDEFCDDMKRFVMDTYRKTREGPNNYLRISEYDRADFVPKPRCDVKEHAGIWSHDVSRISPTLRRSLRKLFDHLPSVPLSAQVLATLWAVAATFISWGLAKTWEKGRFPPGSCRKWCSPVDLEPNVLGNIGFALFLILAFRASDAVNRYEDGARTIYDLRMQLRSLAVEVVQSFNDGMLHRKDKERIIAHLVHIPLVFRDLLVGRGRRKGDEREGLLSDEDLDALSKSDHPLDHLMKTVEAYFLTANMPEKETPYKENDKTFAFVVIISSIIRMGSIRTLISKVQGVKRFPVIGSYIRHQRIFTIIWIMLLPFAMTSQTGFFTILWAPIISFGVLGLESIAINLVDPYGNDSTDLRVDKLFTGSANAILDAVNSVNWEIDRHIRESPVDEEPHLGSMLHGCKVVDNYTLPRLTFRTEGESEGKIDMEGPRNAKMNPSFYAHLIRSVPIGQVSIVTGWTVLACVISYLSRDRSLDATSAWWKSIISVSVSVSTYVSTAAFTTLGFYVRGAFGRYNAAGSVWGDHLRGSCHGLAVTFMSWWPDSELHPRDHARILGHLAALPIALKAELRNSRDIREAKGLLSSSDLARIQCAESMSTHCVTVIRAYYYKVMSRLKTITSKKVKGGRLNMITMGDMFGLERTVQTALFLKAVPIAPGFVALLNTLLTIWFGILPFALAELTGWFTILWIMLVSYGILGMYAVAKELANPFGEDLNDLDLDGMSDSIVHDVMSVYENLPDGTVSVVKEADNAPLLTEGSWESGKEMLKGLFREREQMSVHHKVREAISLAVRAVHPFVLVVIGLWAGAITAVSYVVGREAQFGIPQSRQCELWWCSPIDVPAPVQSFVGYALFLLLGFRLNDSHRRYVEALTLWKDGIVGYSRLICSRLYGGYIRGSWHAGDDITRIAGHVCGFAICLMGQLRDEGPSAEKLEKVLGKDDVQRVLRAKQPAEYCLDVVKCYLVRAEELLRDPKHKMGSANELTRLLNHVRALSLSARACTRLRRVPLPFGYVTHLRIFLCIWVLLLPLGLVETSGWLAILWTVVIAYGVVGVESWAGQLANPFGTDVSDVPLEKLCKRAVVVVQMSGHLYGKGLGPFVRRDREAFVGSVGIEGKGVVEGEEEGGSSAMNEASEDSVAKNV